MKPVRLQRCSRLQALSLLLLNHATFPPREQQRLPPAIARLPIVRLMTDMWSLQTRLQLNHVIVASRSPFRVLGSVEIHTTEYLRKRAGNITDEQAANLQPYLCSMAVREDERGKGLARLLVEAAVEVARTTAPPGQWLMLQVESRNIAAFELYQSCGFVLLSDPRCEILLQKTVVDNGRLVPYTPQSVAASLAAVKRAEHAALNQSQNKLEHAQKIPNPHRFRESQPACRSAHTHTGDHRSNKTDPQRG
jgi:GNAT superfamily N-acetyltransferase